MVYYKRNAKTCGLLHMAKKKMIIYNTNVILQIKVGLNLLGNTSVTLRNPAKLGDTGSFTRLSVYFNTTQPDSLLIYIGDNLSTRQVSYQSWG
jgi:predicted TIM-barrel enzyme